MVSVQSRPPDGTVVPQKKQAQGRLGGCRGVTAWRGPPSPPVVGRVWSESGEGEGSWGVGVRVAGEETGHRELFAFPVRPQVPDVPFEASRPEECLGFR